MIMSITVANSMDMNKAKDIKDKLNSLDWAQADLPIVEKLLSLK
jgi:uncharacterized protein YpbB